MDPSRVDESVLATCPRKGTKQRESLKKEVAGLNMARIIRLNLAMAVALALIK